MLHSGPLLWPSLSSTGPAGPCLPLAPLAPALLLPTQPPRPRPLRLPVRIPAGPPRIAGPRRGGRERRANQTYYNKDFVHGNEKSFVVDGTPLADHLKGLSGRSRAQTELALRCREFKTRHTNNNPDNAGPAGPPQTPLPADSCSTPGEPVACAAPAPRRQVEPDLKRLAADLLNHIGQLSASPPPPAGVVEPPKPPLPLPRRLPPTPQPLVPNASHPCPPHNPQPPPPNRQPPVSNPLPPTATFPASAGADRQVHATCPSGITAGALAGGGPRSRPLVPNALLSQPATRGFSPLLSPVPVLHPTRPASGASPSPPPALALPVPCPTGLGGAIAGGPPAAPTAGPGAPPPPATSAYVSPSHALPPGHVPPDPLRVPLRLPSPVPQGPVMCAPGAGAEVIDVVDSDEDRPGRAPAAAPSPPHATTGPAPPDPGPTPSPPPPVPTPANIGSLTASVAPAQGLARSSSPSPTSASSSLKPSATASGGCAGAEQSSPPPEHPIPSTASNPQLHSPEPHSDPTAAPELTAAVASGPAARAEPPAAAAPDSQTAEDPLHAPATDVVPAPAAEGAAAVGRPPEAAVASATLTEGTAGPAVSRVAVKAGQPPLTPVPVVALAAALAGETATYHVSACDNSVLRHWSGLPDTHAVVVHSRPALDTPFSKHRFAPCGKRWCRLRGAVREGVLYLMQNVSFCEVRRPSVVLAIAE